MRKLVLSLGCLMLLSGCATYESQTSSLRASWAKGDVSVSQKLAEVGAEKADEDDALIWSLEQGAVYRANANFAKSIESFDKAYALVEKFENEPETKLSQEATAFLTDQTYIPYKGTHYDKIMLCAYQALNFIETKDFDRAAVEIKRMQNFQDDAKRKNLSRIQSKQRALDEAKQSDKNLKNSKGVLTSQADAKLRSLYGDNYSNTSSLQQAKSLYVNPFGYWLGGVYFANRAQSQSDREQASSLLRICNEMTGGKLSTLLADVKSAEDFANGKTNSFGNITYIVFETGASPVKSQIRLDLPIFIFAENAPHVAVNFPYLKEQKSYRKSVDVSVDGRKIPLEELSNMDAIISEEFYIELPYVIARTLLSSASKATAEYFAARAAGDYGILVHLVMGVYQSSFNNADLRTWQTLPKQIKIARIETPASGKIFIEGAPIIVNPQGVNVIYVKSISETGNIIVRTFDFRDKN